MSALVDYSSSQDDDDDENPLNETRASQAGPSGTAQENETPSLPPLPSSFRTLYATNVRSSNTDDPELHGGRTRQVAHIAGNWPSHVYTEWSPMRSQLPILKDIINKFREVSGVTITSLVVNDLGVAQPLHISLSQSLQVPTEERAELLQALVKASSSSGLYAFHVDPACLKWVSNHDGSRWFLALALKRPDRDELNQLLRLCNRTVHALSYPLLYVQDVEDEADRSDYFHFSLAWALSSDIRGSSDLEEALDRAWSSVAEKQHKLRVLIDALCVKLGNAVHHITLYRQQALQ